MKLNATISSGVAAINVTVSGDGHIIRAIVTREMLEHLYGQIGASQNSLLSAFKQHAPAVGALIVDKYRDSRKDPVILHFNEPESCEAN